MSLKKITKKYPGVLALNEINITFEKGKVHGIVGENGAGKSTLIKIMTGAVEATSGEVYFKEVLLSDHNAMKRIGLGIHAVYQEFNLFLALSIEENIFYGHEISNGIVLNKKTMRKKTNELLQSLGIKLSSMTLIRDIGIGNQQIVEIAKALVKNVEVLILDEPTASLTKKETQNLFKIINRLKDEGVCIIYISHKLDEVFEITDDVSVFRDGELIIRKETNAFTEDQLIKSMVGRTLKNIYREEITSNKENIFVLELKNICTKYINDVSFQLKKGEILGIAGLMSSGRTEIANAIFGVDKVFCGYMLMHGHKIKVKSPEHALKHGISFITEDRKNLGLILDMSIKENTSYSALYKWEKAGIINKSMENKAVKAVLSNLDVRYASLKSKVRNLSGGNQQKVVIGKSLLTDSDVIIFDEPTRGIDIGAKEEVYKIMIDLVKMGKSIIMISSEMTEILSLSDRIIVMSNGRKVSEYNRGEVSSEQIFIDSSSLLKERDYG